MINVSPDQITQWFRHSRLGINGFPAPNEIKTDCPYCGYSNFYFNVVKQVGKCHKANCGGTPKLEDLIEVIGYGPIEDDIYRPPVPRGGPKEPEPLTLEALPLVTFKDNEYKIWSTKAWDYLVSRNLTLAHILRHDIRWNGKRVIVPVYNTNGDVVQHVGRLVEGEGLRYKYHSGVNIQQFIFGWAEAKLWPRLTLVENTFNSIWLRETFYCTTNFGSNLSPQQIAMIKVSHAKSVALLWDEGADNNALKAVHKLTKIGIPACFAQINGQPDDHPLPKLVDWVEQTHKAANDGKLYVNFRGNNA